MKNFWDTQAGRFLYTSVKREYDALVVGRQRLPEMQLSTLTGGIYTESPDADSVTVAMDGKEYRFSVPEGDMQQLKPGAHVGVLEKKGSFLSFPISPSYFITDGGLRREVLMKPAETQ
jgi:hypothetical protein